MTAYIQLNDLVRYETAAEDSNAQDEEIFTWIQAAWDEAEQEATREGAPVGEYFSQAETTTCVPIDMENEDSDLEEERLRLHLQDDLEAAVREGFSFEPSDEVVMHEAGTSLFDNVDLTNWQEVPESGVVNEFDEVSLASTRMTIELDDTENVEEVESFTQGSVTLKARDDAMMKEEPAGSAEELKKEETLAQEKEVEKKQAGRLADVNPQAIPMRPKVTPIYPAAEKLAQATEKAEGKQKREPVRQTSSHLQEAELLLERTST